MYKIIPGGRFGNNVIQLVNAIRLALQTGVNTIIHEFDFLDSDRIVLDDMKEKTVKILFRSQFKLLKDLKCHYNTYDEQLHSASYIAQKYILPQMKYTIPETIVENELVVHIRGGDLFNETGWVSPFYVQPPLEYYVKIFELEKDKKISVFYEDDRNPVTDKLRVLYPDIVMKSVALEELVRIFINAEYVVSGNGTLILAILFMNKRLKRHYTTGAGGDSGGGIPFLMDELKGGKTILAKFPGYITTWNNSIKNRALMLTYTGTIV